MKNERGSAIVNVLIIITALAILGMALSKMSAYHLMEISRLDSQAQARQAAESGIEEILYRLQNGPGWYADGSDTMPFIVRELDGWGYEAQVYPIMGGNIYQLVVNGYSGKVEQQVERTAVITTPIRYALYALEKIEVGGGVTINGPIYAGDEIEGYLPPTAFPDTYPKEIHTWEMPEMKVFTQLGPDRIVNSFFRGYRIENRYLLRHGPLTLQKGTLTNTSWVVDGVLTVEGNTSATSSPGRPLFFVDGDALFSLGSRSTLQGVIICTGKCRITGVGILVGSVIAENIEIIGDIEIRQSTDLTDLPAVIPTFCLIQ